MLAKWESKGETLQGGLKSVKSKNELGETNGCRWAQRNSQSQFRRGLTG